MATQHPSRARLGATLPDISTRVSQPMSDGVTATVAGEDGTVLVTISRHVQPAPAGSAPDGDLTIVVVDGDVDHDTAPLMRVALLQALDAHPRVCCDLRSVRFFGAAGVNTLMAAHQHARTLGRTFTVRGVHGLTATILQVTGFDDFVARAS